MTPQEAYNKCENKINKELEPYIIKSPHWAYFYAKDIIRGRWKEAEQYIINNSQWTYCYARDVIESKLPENMHNAMLLYADDYWAKEYFYFIKS